MNLGLSDQVRALATAKYVRPALQSGKKQFSIRVKDLWGDLRAEGFPARHSPQICSALQTSKFLNDNGLQVEGVDGPPSKKSSTVVVRYRVADKSVQPVPIRHTREDFRMEPDQEDPDAWALRLTEKLRGLLKEELAAYGGGEAFLRWIRSEEEDTA
jgi:hypothetical protein